MIDSGLNDATREMLLRERSAVLARMEVVTRDALDVELESDGIPPSSYEREHAIKSMLDSRLAEIDHALERMDSGVYGVCAECKKEIPLRRLQALPFATLCVACQGLADKRARRMALR